MKKNFLKYIFSIDNNSTNRTIIYFLGFKIRHIKSSVLNRKSEYIKLNCPVSEIPKATGPLRQIQLADLKLMEIFNKLCENHGLTYWLDFGNLLGAVRHNGFIPWDDDVDLSMIRDDYEKFIELFKNGIDDYPDLYLEFNNNGKNKCFVKLLHKKIPNIQIDIFPYDFYYKSTNAEEKQNLTKLMKSYMNKWYYKALFLFFKTQHGLMRKRFKNITTKKILRNNKVDISSKPSLFYGIDYPHQHKQLVFDYDTIFPLKKVQFEDKEFLAPNNIDKLLTDEFGNYMSLPNDCYPRHASENEQSKDITEEIERFINLGV